MKLTGQDKRLLGMVVAGLGVVALWGYASGDMQRLFQRRGGAQVEQRALDHLFGSDRSFDAAADKVTKAASGEDDDVAWKTLADARMDAGAQGAAFGAAVEALDGQEVTISGYMFPLEASGGQEHFLLSAYPPSCPYCLPGGPSELIEISDSQAMDFTYDRITVQGMFHVLKQGGDGMLYRMTQVKRR